MKIILIGSMFLSILTVKGMKNDSIINNVIIYSDTLVSISAEKVLYEREMSNNFYIKFKIENKTTKTIGVDLTNFYQVIHPWQYCISKTPFLNRMGGIENVPEILTVTKRETMLAEFKEGKLTTIAPNQAVEYYREFNGGFNKSDKEKLKINEQEYFIITLSGQLFITNGNSVENICFCIDNKDANSNRLISLTYPLIWKTIPEKSRILKNN